MPENRTALMQYRYSAAKERIDSAQILYDAGNYKDSIGRSYYAMFSAVCALLAMEGKDFARHPGVISYFQKEYIKTGKFDVKFSKYISQAFQIRNNTDYTDFYVVSQEDAKEQLDKAREFAEAVGGYLKIEDRSV